MMQDYQPKVTDYKKKAVDEIVDLFTKYKVVALINMEDLPAYQLQKMRKQLRDKIVFKMTKKSFIERAMDKVKRPNADQLKEKVTGMPALIFTNEDPFKLYKLIEKNKSAAPAKAGQLAPMDIILPAGPTPFTPGPMIGELGQLGIKTEVKEGKIGIREDKILVKKGDVINQKTAELLPKFGIEPMEIGLNIILTYENGELIFKDVLSITDEQYLSDILKAFSASIALALDIGYTTEETVKILVQRAYMEAKSVAGMGHVEVSEEINKSEDVGVVNKEVQIDRPVIKEDAVPNELKHENIVIEYRKPVDMGEVEKAQEVLQKLQDSGVESLKKKEEAKKEEQHRKQEQDINKIINQLKDKKARGEI